MTINVGDRIQLQPKSKKGKQRLKDFPSTGEVLEIRQSVCFSDKKGPWLLVKGGDPTSRWVHIKEDPNFDIEH